ncbi:GAF domain-containing protein [Paracoccus sp. (in: a-proteobacteria)]|uniref:GAF domain-containing protein n=1 Tax=Paracoccus sp. TaxID=267 RepID=UPI003A87053A
MTAWRDFAAAIAAPGGEAACMAALCALTQQEIGAVLFTVMTFDEATRCATRIWSNMPDAYPAGGTKPVGETAWVDLVLNRHQPFVANNIDEIAAHFGDHDLIRSLGCESCLNLPLVIAGRVPGTLNCLDVAGHYTPERVARAARLIAPAALCLQRMNDTSKRGKPA